MGLPIQRGFFEDRYLAVAQQKVAELYFKNPQIAENDKRACIEYWQTYEGLGDVLGKKLPTFISWFYGATSTATITRCLRAMKQDGSIQLPQGKRRQREESARNWSQYWSNERFH